jgi:hypothetical protein
MSGMAIDLTAGPGALAAIQGQKALLRAQFQPIESRSALDGVRGPGAHDRPGR